MDAARLRQALLRPDSSLVIFVGSGVSVSASIKNGKLQHPCATWTGLLEEGLRRVPETQSWKEWHLTRLKGGDAAAFVEVAQVLRDRLEKERAFAAFLVEAFQTMECCDNALRDALQMARKRGAAFATTNYDGILEGALGESTVHRSEKQSLKQWIDHGRGVFHAHGHFSKPQDVVLGVSDYNAVLESELTQYALNSLSHKTIIFIGAGPTGLGDPNVSKLLAKMASLKLGERFVLARESEVGSFNHDVVVPVSYGPNYADFVPFLRFLFAPDATILKPPQTAKRGPFIIKTSLTYKGQEMYLCQLKNDTQFREIFLRPFHDLRDTYHHFWMAEFEAAHLMVYLETPDGSLALSPGVVVTTVQRNERHRLCAGQLGIVHFNLIATADQWIGGSSCASILWSWREGKDRFFLKPVHVGWPDPANEDGMLYEWSTAKTQKAAEGLRFSLITPSN